MIGLLDAHHVMKVGAAMCSMQALCVFNLDSMVSKSNTGNYNFVSSVWQRCHPESKTNH